MKPCNTNQQVIRNIINLLELSESENDKITATELLDIMMLLNFVREKNIDWKGLKKIVDYIDDNQIDLKELKTFLKLKELGAFNFKTK
ncbi:MAG: hypothetical protein FWF56_04625 [Firmicutes bacterium]|nr:hypothetical protein [Bacillota bacterium]MCL1953677.1 hypothetical protein [Bacillota bacterium]